ncbi:MAG: translation initiation factor IF-2 [Methanomassiliicoccales archaeon]|nr:MAG: translation initiation factor IF-2 [Methanomassiliicoccales archaeon]
MIRQPIVSVLGHVDHGKTTILDAIRGTAVVSREAGAITQHIGATEVPLETILEMCKKLVGKRRFKIPGLLFIDTPGHHSFVTLRARGGALADLALLVVDINEGFMPQTIESLNILKRFKTPFIIVANKIDRIMGWRRVKNVTFLEALEKQPDSAKERLEELLYELVGKLYELGLPGDRYDKISDFTANVGIVPVSAKYNQGIPDALLILIGLAQRYLKEDLKTEEGPAEGTVLEVKEEKGLGPTVDAIIFKGTIQKGDTMVLGSKGEPIVTKVRALLKPKPLDEIRDPEDRFNSVDSVSAAAGIKISASDLENAVAGAPIIVVEKDVQQAKDRVIEETSVEIETDEDGVIAKADAIGSLEALAYELKRAEIPLKSARVGDVSRRDVVDAATIRKPLNKVILAFNVNILPDAKEEMRISGAHVIQDRVVYKLVEDYQAWVDEKKRGIEAEKRMEITYPGKILLLPDCCFRVSKPAIFGARVLAGRIRPGQRLLREDGRVLGKIKSVQSEKQSLKEAIVGSEVAIAVEGITYGRQVDVGDVLYIDLPESHARALDKVELNPDENEVLEKVREIKRTQDPFWGM